MTLMLTTEGNTLAAMPAYDAGTTLSDPDGRVTDGNAAVEPFAWSSVAPTVTPIPPNTSADAPATAAVVRQAGRVRRGCGCSGSTGAASCTGGQNRSVMTPRVAPRSERKLNSELRRDLGRHKLQVVQVGEIERLQVDPARAHLGVA